MFRDASRHLLLPASACLASHAAEELARDARRDELWVVLPTQRLMTWVQAAMARQLKAYRPPRFMTLEQFIEAVAGDTPTVAPDDVIERLLADHLQQSAYTHLRVGHERELRLFFEEIIDNDRDEDAFERLETVLVEDIYRGDRHRGSLFERIHEMAAARAHLEAELAQAGVVTRARARQKIARAVLEKLGGGFVFPGRRVLIAGLTSVQEGWLPLISALACHEQVSFVLTEPGQSGPSPLQRLITTIGEAAGWRKGEGERRIAPVYVAEAPSLVAECEGALALARGWIKDGVPAHDVALIVTSDKDYGALLTSLIEEAGERANIALPLPFYATRRGLWLRELAVMLGREEPAERFFMWCLQPLTLARLGGMVPDMTAETIGEAVQRAWQKQNDPTRRIAGVEPESLRVALTSLWQNVKLLGGDAQEKPLGQWRREISEFLAAFPVTANGFEERSDESLDEFFESFAPFAAGIQGMHGRMFWRWLERKMGALEVRGIGEPLSGLQVLSLPEARHIPFQAMIILGANEGSFPKGLPEDDLVDDYLKRAIGLPGWRVLESMEDVTFSLLRRRVPHLVLTRAREIGGSPTVRSRFIERLHCEASAVFTTLPEAARAARPILISEEGVAPGVTQTLERLSATAAEQFVRCPYRYVVGQALGVPDQPLFFEGADARAEGEWLHEVLERFLGKNERQAWPATLDGQEAFIVGATTRLMFWTEKLAPAGTLAAPLARHLRHTAWPRFAAHLWRLYEGKPLERLFEGRREERFGGGGETVSLAGEQRRLVGKIDSIDFPDGLTVVTDYKSGATPPMRELKQGIAPQLVFYGLALEKVLPHWSADDAVYGYYRIRDGKWEPRAVGDNVRGMALERRLITKLTPSFRDVARSFEGALDWRLKETVERFNADPSLCGYCRFDGLCRRRDPWNKARFEDQRALALRLKDDAEEETT